MVYVCERCHFEFERMSEVEQCPDCGKIAIRMATASETLAFRNRLQEYLESSGESNKDNFQ